MEPLKTQIPTKETQEVILNDIENAIKLLFNKSRFKDDLSLYHFIIQKIHTNFILKDNNWECLFDCLDDDSPIYKKLNSPINGVENFTKSIQNTINNVISTYQNPNNNSFL